MEAFIPLTALPLQGRHRITRDACARRLKVLAAADKPKSKSPSDSFSGYAAGPGKPSRSRATRALGKKRATKPKAIETNKTAADFVAEGVVDDVDGGFAVEDIRFGIDDVEDPFLRDEKLRKAEEDKKEDDGDAKDVIGDGGVLKTILEVGRGEVVPPGARVKVGYVGTRDGVEFDRSSDDKPFEFVLGRGEVIKGWEAGVRTMKKGEKALLKIMPSYGYGRRGMPPVIPGNATLEFEVCLQDFVGGESEEGEIKRVADFNPTVARTPDEIDAEYRERMKTREERRRNMSLLERFYIISPFASQTGEKAPWWLNPNITFVVIMLGVAFGFYLVYVSGAIHVGYVDESIDVNIFK